MKYTHARTHFRRKYFFLSNDYFVLFMKKETYIIVNRNEEAKWEKKQIINSSSSGSISIACSSKTNKKRRSTQRLRHFRSATFLVGFRLCVYVCILWKLTDATWKSIAFIIECELTSLNSITTIITTTTTKMCNKRVKIERYEDRLTYAYTKGH